MSWKRERELRRRNGGETERGGISIEQQRGGSVLHYPSDHFLRTSVFARLSSDSRKRVRILLIAHSSFPQPEILDFWRFSDLEEDLISTSSSFWRGTLLGMIVIITPWILGNLEFDLWSQVKGLILMVTPIHR